MERIIVLYSLLAYCLAISCLQAQNEIVVHDPVVARHGGTYYLFCTGNGIDVYSSKDLKQWHKEQSVFGQAPQWTHSVVSDFKNHIWAPDIIFHAGKYYLFYSVSSFAKNTSAIGVATNGTLNRDDENFKWVDHGIVVQSVPNRDLWNAIDPNIVFDNNQHPWMSFGSFWNGLKMVKLTDDLLAIKQPEEWLTVAKRERSFHLDDTDPGDAELEAPFIFKKGKYYYLFVSWGLCCRGEASTYKMAVGRSESATGPFVDHEGTDMNYGGGKIIFESHKDWFGAGHNSVYTFDGKDYVFFHAYLKEKNGLPVLKVAELSWEDGWPILIIND